MSDFISERLLLWLVFFWTVEVWVYICVCAPISIQICVCVCVHVYGVKVPATLELFALLDCFTVLRPSAALAGIPLNCWSMYICICKYVNIYICMYIYVNNRKYKYIIYVCVHACICSNSACNFLGFCVCCGFWIFEFSELSLVFAVFEFLNFQFVSWFLRFFDFLNFWIVRNFLGFCVFFILTFSIALHLMVSLLNAPTSR